MKGISPLFSFALMIAVTCGLALLVILFFTGFIKISTTSASGGGSSLISCGDSHPTVTLVRYPAGGSGMMNVTFANPGNDVLYNVIIYTAMSNGATYANSSGTLGAMASNSSQLFNILGLGNPKEVRVVGVCTTTGGNLTVSGSCVLGAVCMKGV
jgi:FlaG/FlaF family flagellin (archaellin)